MHLLVDIGNSRIKWALDDDTGIAGPWRIERSQSDLAERLSAAWSGLDPSSVVLCSVGDRDAAESVVDWSRGHWSARIEEVYAWLRCGDLRNAYADPSTLGADRWANLLAARAAAGRRDVIVADAGTALTVDGVRADGCHVGGAILAGRAAAHAGLRQAAPSLPGPAAAGRLPATTTPEALAAGGLIGLAGALDRVADDVATGLEDPAYYLCGGDAAALVPQTLLPWVHDPLLTLRGVAAAREAGCVGSH